MRIVISVVVSVLAFFLTACGGEDEPMPSKDDIYLETIREDLPELDGADDTDLIDLAYLTCATLGSGGTMKDLFESAQGSGIDVYTQGFLIGAAVRVYCPENMSDIIR